METRGKVPVSGSNYELGIISPEKMNGHEKVIYPSRDDPLVNLNRLVSKKRRVTGRHFVHKNTEGPPVHSFVVSL